MSSLNGSVKSDTLDNDLTEKVSFNEKSFFAKRYSPPRTPSPKNADSPKRSIQTERLVAVINANQNNDSGQSSMTESYNESQLFTVKSFSLHEISSSNRKEAFEIVDIKEPLSIDIALSSANKITKKNGSSSSIDSNSRQISPSVRTVLSGEDLPSFGKNSMDIRNVNGNSPNNSLQGNHHNHSSSCYCHSTLAK